MEEDGKMGVGEGMKTFGAMTSMFDDSSVSWGVKRELYEVVITLTLT